MERVFYHESTTYPAARRRSVRRFRLPSQRRAGCGRRHFELADRIKSGAVHINDQTVDDEAMAPFGGTKASGAGGHFGNSVNLDTSCDVAVGRREHYA
jgi:hypothetical protein